MDRISLRHTLILSLTSLIFLPLFFLSAHADTTKQRHLRNIQSVETFFSKQSHNNWAVLVCTSRFWFNYRHIANTLSIYRTVKRLGIPDSNIILMLAEDVACNPRNVFPGTVINNADKKLDLYGSNVEVDYRGYEVTVENFIRVLTGRTSSSTPPSKRLLTDDRSNVLVYMTGHGGDEFLKFQNAEELSSQDLADAFGQMWERRRYKNLFFMIDTCQASTMYERIYTPNVLATGSAKRDQNSYSHHMDMDVGVAVIDRFTYYNLEFLEKVKMSGGETLQDLFNTYKYSYIHSDPGIRTDLFSRLPSQVKVTEFFGGVQDIELVLRGYNLTYTSTVATIASSASKSSPKEQPNKLKVHYLSDALEGSTPIGSDGSAADTATKTGNGNNVHPPPELTTASVKTFSFKVWAGLALLGLIGYFST